MGDFNLLFANIAGVLLKRFGRLLTEDLANHFEMSFKISQSNKQSLKHILRRMDF